MLTRETAGNKLINLNIQTATGDVEVRIGTLSVGERGRIVASVPDPKPASTQYVDGGQTKTKVDDKNPEYLKAVDEATMARNARLVMASLIKGGNFADLAEASDDERTEYALNNLDSDLFYGVLSALVQLRTRLQVTVNAVKDSF